MKKLKHVSFMAVEKERELYFSKINSLIKYIVDSNESLF